VRDFYYFQAVNGFQWYDTGQNHIMTNSTFRNCRNDWEYCIFGPSAWTCSGSAVFTSLSHSDEYVPQLMQTTADIIFENVTILYQFSTLLTDPEGITVSGRNQNWLDYDGSASLLGVPAMIGSARGGGWWSMNSECTTVDERILCPLQPGDAAASMVFHYNAAYEAEIGSTICINGNYGGNIPCPLIGNVTHFGRAESTGLLLAANAQVSGPVVYTAGGWFVRFTEGIPTTITIANIQIDPTVSLVLAFPYPAGTTFNVTYEAASWCGTSWAVCSHPFNLTKSLTNVYNSNGDLYYWNSTSNILFIRVVEQQDTFTTAEAWTSIPPVPDIFVRANITMDLYQGAPYIQIVANCPTNPCAPQPNAQVPPALFLSSSVPSTKTTTTSSAAKTTTKTTTTSSTTKTTTTTTSSAAKTTTTTTSSAAKTTTTTSSAAKTSTTSSSSAAKTTTTTSSNAASTPSTSAAPMSTAAQVPSPTGTSGPASTLNDTGLGAGPIAGIVVGLAVVILGVLAAALFVVRRSRKTTPRSSEVGLVDPPKPVSRTPAPPPAYKSNGLPPGWTEEVDPDTNEPYFHNSATGATQWERPGLNVN